MTMEVGIPDIYGFTDYMNLIDNDVYDEKIDDLVSADVLFDKTDDLVCEPEKYFQPQGSYVSNSVINPDDFLNDVEVEEVFRFCDRSSPEISNSSASPTDYLNLKQETSSDVESMHLESPPINHNQYLNATAITFPPNQDQIRLFQGALIPVVSAIKIETGQTPTSQPQRIVVNGFRKAKNKIVLPKMCSDIKTIGCLTVDGKGEPDAQRQLLAKADLIKERAIKKQQRMIKNRESASLSRNKKKEYVISLETKVKCLLDENSLLKNENCNLRAQISNMQGACKCGSGQYSCFIKTISSQNRKNTAILLAMIFMVSMSFGNFNSFLSRNLNPTDDLISVNSKEHVGRGLLWTSELAASDENVLRNVSNEAAVYPICPFSVNQTENIRIATELRKWIGVNKNSNSTQYDESIFNHDLNAIKPNINNLDKLRKYYSKKKNPHATAGPVDSIKKRWATVNSKNQMQLFSPPRVKGRFSKLFEEIGRRDDTFYVLSFNSDHLLLSAANHNKTARPKISFVLPADDSFLNDKMTLMQIDCEVINTTVIQLKKEFIPDHLRTTTRESKFEMFDVTGQRANSKNDYRKMYKPYFINKSNFAKDSRSADLSPVFIP